MYLDSAGRTDMRGGGRSLCLRGGQRRRQQRHRGTVRIRTEQIWVLHNAVPRTHAEVLIDSHD